MNERSLSTTGSITNTEKLASSEILLSVTELAALPDTKYGQLDLYARLGVSRRALDSEINAAFRNLSNHFHPDKGGSTPKMQLLVEAKSVLLNKAGRASYDAGTMDWKTILENLNKIRNEWVVADIESTDSHLFSSQRPLAISDAVRMAALGPDRFVAAVDEWIRNGAFGDYKDDVASIAQVQNAVAERVNAISSSKQRVDVEQELARWRELGFDV